MADRFPSLDDFDAGQTEARGHQPDLDTVGDAGTSSFLDRERAVLGDEFTTAGDNAAAVEDVDDDLLGGGGGGGGQYHAADGAAALGGFESDFPAIDTSNDHMAPGGTITGDTASYGAPAASSYQAAFSNEPEPEVVREWRERRDVQIQNRDAASQSRKEETVAKAREDIDAFYESYNDKKEHAIKTTRAEAEAFLSGREDTAAGGTSWERIAKLVDLTGKGGRGGGPGSGKERMRELLISLRKDEKAPGATGY